MFTATDTEDGLLWIGGQSAQGAQMTWLNGEVVFSSTNFTFWDQYFNHQTGVETCLSTRWCTSGGEERAKLAEMECTQDEEYVHGYVCERHSYE